jgi:hypothetical protein
MRGQHALILEIVGIAVPGISPTIANVAQRAGGVAKFPLQLSGLGPTLQASPHLAIRGSFNNSFALRTYLELG